MTVASSPFTVAICTRNRTEHLRATLAALERQTIRDFEVIVVDQSDHPHLQLISRTDLAVNLVPDRGRGLARARNLAAGTSVTDWIVFLDDDCLPEPDWAEQLGLELARRPDASVVAGHVGERDVPRGDYLRVSVFEVHVGRRRQGRWVRPWEIGLGVCMAVRRQAITELGGFDERLGAGAPDFPASEDMDFNYRLLRSGRVAYTIERVRAFHDQWRTQADLGPLYCGYMASWSGFAMKHLRGGDVAGGLWLWALGLHDLFRMVGSSFRRRSLLRLRVSGWKLRGLVVGTLKGLTRTW